MKKVFLAIFAFLAVSGIVVLVAGFSLGGRAGALYAQDGRMVYATRNEEIPLGSAPGWWPEGRYVSLGWNSNLGNYSLVGTGDVNSSASSSGTARSEAAASGTVQEGLPPSIQDIREIDIEISAGKVILQTGDVPSIQVDGRLPATSRYDAQKGLWTIEAKQDGMNFDNGRYWWRGEDWSTTYTITIPASFNELDIDLNMGELVLNQAVAVNKAEVTTNMGSVHIQDMTAQQADFETDMGSMDILNFSGEECQLKVSMGGIEFTGSVSRQLEADCDMGSIQASLARPSQYGYEAEVGMGSISIDGRQVARVAGGKEESNTGATPFYDLECGMGSIEIKFH